MIEGGAEPYDADFVLQLGIINFPFSIPAYDVDDQLTICYDQPGILPSYDASTNTLHFPTSITGTGTIILDEILDDNGCKPAFIDPNFTTLDFVDQEWHKFERFHRFQFLY